MTRHISSILLIFLVACSGWDSSFVDPSISLDEESDRTAPDLGGDEGDRAEMKAEWGPRDDPSLFDDDLEYRVSELPQNATLDVAPWAASYWPVYEDSINYRWAGASTDSPAAKYGLAFGVDNVEDKVSQNHGIERYTSRTACTTDDQCNADIGEACAKRTGADNGHCIPTWWGICHAWAPASMLIAEPEHAVTRNDVEFKVNDIKALVTLSYNQTNTRFVSLRCNEDDDDIEYDQYHRPTGSDLECADTNPGTYHVLLTNYLGLRGQSFVEDRTFDAEVWNQPLRAYRITKMDQITPAEANELVGVEPEGTETTTHDANATVAAGAWHHVDPYTVVAGQEVVVAMTGSADADLYVRFGSQATASAYDCRPYETGSDETCTLTAPASASKVYVSVNGYEGSAVIEIETTLRTMPAGGSVTSSNFSGSVAAGAWFHQPAIDVSGADSARVVMTGTSDADLHVRIGHQPTDAAYDCRPWLAGSEEQCQVNIPAGATELFVSAKGYSGTSDIQVTVTVSSGGNGISNDYVFNPDSGLALYEVNLEVDYISESSASVDGNLSGSIDTYTRTDHYTYVLEVDSAGKIVGGEWTGSSKTNHPDFLWLPLDRDDTQTMAGGSIQWSLVKELLDASVASDDGGDDDDDDGGPTLETVDNNGTLAANQWQHYGPFEAAVGTVSAEMTGTGDADLYVRKGAQPTTSAYDCRPYRNGSTESCSLEGPGDFYVSVRGYTAATFDLTVSFYTGAGDDTVDPDPDPYPVSHLNESGNVAQGEMKLFTINVDAGKPIVVRTQAPNDVDLYVRFGSAPTTSSYDKRGYTGSGNETIEFTPSADGVLHIGVHGYAASSFVVMTADN